MYFFTSAKLLDSVQVSPEQIKSDCQAGENAQRTGGYRCSSVKFRKRRERYCKIMKVNRWPRNWYSERHFRMPASLKQLWKEDSSQWTSPEDMVCSGLKLGTKSF